MLGHITTFGGHPVCCAAGMAAFKVLLQNDFGVSKKEQLFKSGLQNSKINFLRSFGLWLAIEFESFEICKAVIDKCIEGGLITDWFLFSSNCLRISPPLTISEEQIKNACETINNSIGQVCSLR